MRIRWHFTRTVTVCARCVACTGGEILLFAFFVLFACPRVSHAQAADPAPEIGKLMTTLHERDQFNGEVIVAQNGRVIYRNAFGPANAETVVALRPDTPTDIGSVAKQFTAMAIMQLKERGLIGYDDPVAKSIPEFTNSKLLGRISLRHLLNHTSGIPDYGDLNIDDSTISQKDLITLILKKESSLAEPGQRYRYSNVGYALLAIVVENITRQKFGAFLESEIFRPAQMSNTFLYDSPAKRSGLAAIGYNQFGQIDDGGPTRVPGDGGIFSTADDLLKWDQILSGETLVKQPELREAFTPGRVRAGTSSYGFGWNVADHGDYVWHQGNHAGFRAFIGRRLKERITVILLTNKGNSKRQEIDAAIQNILRGKHYSLPKRSGAQILYQKIHQSGIESALQSYRELKNGAPGDYEFGESELNTLGYQLLYGDKKPTDAIAIFKLNTDTHPRSSNAFDSLGEAYHRGGQNNLAIECYRKAVKLDSSNGHAAEALKELN